MLDFIEEVVNKQGDVIVKKFFTLIGKAKKNGEIVIFENCKFDDNHIPGISVPVEFINCDFNRCVISGRFINSSFIGCNFNSCVITHCRLIDCEAYNNDIINCSIASFKWVIDSKSKNAKTFITRKV